MQCLALSESIKVSYDMSNALSPKTKSLSVLKLISSAPVPSICSFHPLTGLNSIPHTSSLLRLYHCHHNSHTLLKDAKVRFIYVVLLLLVRDMCGHVQVSMCMDKQVFILCVCLCGHGATSAIFLNCAPPYFYYTIYSLGILYMFTMLLIISTPHSPFNSPQVPTHPS